MNLENVLVWGDTIAVLSMVGLLATMWIIDVFGDEKKIKYSTENVDKTIDKI